jgi:hypothetical protein
MVWWTARNGQKNKTNYWDEMRRLNKKYGAKFPLGYKYYLRDRAKFMKTPESKQMMELCRYVPDKYRKYTAFALAEMLMPDMMCRLQFGKYLDEADCKQMWLIDFEDVLFYLNNIFKGGHAIDRVIAHFEQKNTIN